MPRRKAKGRDKEQNNETKQDEASTNIYMNPGTFDPNVTRHVTHGANPYCYETNNYDNLNDRVEYQRYQPIYYIYGYPPPAATSTNSFESTGDGFLNHLSNYENIIEQEVYNENHGMTQYDIPQTQPYVTIINGVSYYMQPMLSSPFVTAGQQPTGQQERDFEQSQGGSSFCSDEQKSSEFQRNYYDENTNKNIYKTSEGYTVEEPSSGTDEKNPAKN